MINENRFYEAVKMLPPFEKLLVSAPKTIISCATEIRVRAGRPLIIETLTERYVCGTRCANTDEIYACIKSFCNYSIHSCQRELSEGWITLKGGHRVGFTGTAHIKDGKLETIKDISALNIRIAREHTGISDNLYSILSKMDNFHGLIIAGSPLSGKTTFLRDLCRNLGSKHKVALIDERSEIAAVYMGVPQNDVGVNTDVLNCFLKKEGIELAVRVMSPEYIVCDEAGQDTDTLLKCSGNGVKPVISIHCGNIDEASRNKSIMALINSGLINYIAFLGSGKNTGNMEGLWCVENGKNINSCNNSNSLLRGGYCNIRRT